jgi:hypothetical protein
MMDESNLKTEAQKVFAMLVERRMLKQLCTKKEAIVAGKAWLGGILGISSLNFDISELNAVQCKKVIDVCNPYIYGVKK